MSVYVYHVTTDARGLTVAALREGLAAVDKRFALEESDDPNATVFFDGKPVASVWLCNRANVEFADRVEEMRAAMEELAEEDPRLLGGANAVTRAALEATCFVDIQFFGGGKAGAEPDPFDLFAAWLAANRKGVSHDGEGHYWAGDKVLIS